MRSLLLESSFAAFGRWKSKRIQRITRDFSGFRCVSTAPSSTFHFAGAPKLLRRSYRSSTLKSHWPLATSTKSWCDTYAFEDHHGHRRTSLDLHDLIACFSPTTHCILKTFCDTMATCPPETPVHSGSRHSPISASSLIFCVSEKNHTFRPSSFRLSAVL